MILIDTNATGAENGTHQPGELQLFVEELIGLLDLPAFGASADLTAVFQAVLDYLVGKLQLAFAYAQLDAGADDSWKAVLAAPTSEAPPHELHERLTQWLPPPAPTGATVVVPSPLGPGELAICHFSLGTDRESGGVVVGATRADFPLADEMVFLRVAVNQLRLELQRAPVRAAPRPARELESAKKDERQQPVPGSEDERERQWHEIVGQSRALRTALRLVEQVAPTGACVLIQGETGTGKELIARAIHRLSNRRDAAFVKMNCAAIPTGLLESELFGHEKGAFTGAIARKVGRFELATGGTLFLDEVGDIPGELQAKFLRVLQERELERLGSTRTLRVDVRVVAASNRDLAQMVKDRQFRSDLYYRLNVFPILVPPLRERVEDIPLLARCFTDRHARRCHKEITEIPDEVVDALCRHHWPGNIRELENFIERSVILTRGSVLEIPFGELAPAAAVRSTPGGPATLENLERQHIIRALDASRWVIAGPAGAAAKLGMKRTSLQHRMRKLGIARPRR
jgi:formate hydrogenlyase transcriptional activator